jgi:alanine racemase
MTMVDVTDIDDVGVGDTATLIGADGPLRIDAAAAAQWAGTIHYETVARIHPSVPRLHGDGSDDEESTA